ncbi:hypothetical protein BOS5A_230020 [Bosea sp. EC-HK365B]|nr:hypothetical protein BOS5A_230020 [Bosea sp. EC-HK365B]
MWFKPYLGICWFKPHMVHRAIFAVSAALVLPA